MVEGKVLALFSRAPLQHRDMVDLFLFACFTNRRRNRARIVNSPSGRFVFVCVKPQVYRPPSSGSMADPAQALCDLAYLACRRGLDPQTLVTFRELDRIPTADFDRLLPHYPRTVARTVRGILS
jgi:hypothetical protein